MIHTAVLVLKFLINLRFKQLGDIPNSVLTRLGSCDGIDVTTVLTRLDSCENNWCLAPS